MSALFAKVKGFVKKYGYVGIPVHTGLSVVWIGSCYGLTKLGLDVIPLLEKTSLPDKYIKWMKEGNRGQYAQAIVLYKVISPIRYGATIVATKYAVKLLRSKGSLIK